MVKDVEELRPEAKPHFLGNVKLPLQPDIGLRCGETPQHIAPEITLLPGGCHRKCRAIEDFATGILRTLEIKRHSRAYVRAWREPGTHNRESCTNNVNGRGRSGQNETVQRPVAQYALTILCDPGEGRS